MTTLKTIDRRLTAKARKLYAFLLEQNDALAAAYGLLFSFAAAAIAAALLPAEIDN